MRLTYLLSGFLNLMKMTLPIICALRFPPVTQFNVIIDIRMVEILEWDAAK